MNPEDLARQRWRPVAKAVDKRSRLGEELRVTNERLVGLRAELPRAEEADREAHATAIAAGDKAEPGRKAEQLATRIEAEERRAEALRLAIEKTESELRKLRDENRSAGRKATFSTIAKAHLAYEESIRRVEAARDALADEVALAGWITDGIGASHVVDRLGGQISDTSPLSFSQVLRSLNEDAEQIALHLRDLEPRASFKRFRDRAETLQALGLSRAEAVQQASPSSEWGGE
jgi:hypothetical protein